MNKLKYQGYSILLQEVPGEVSLAFSISGCPYRCRGCHSQYLWEYAGRYLSDDFDDVLEMYKGSVTCVCFMGGDQNEDELINYCMEVHSAGLKTCLYTGADYISDRLVEHLDYVKTGPYVSERGGLDKKSTNQRMYRVEIYKGARRLLDITHMFTKEYKTRLKKRE